jgi:hypothetical protein
MISSYEILTSIWILLCGFWIDVDGDRLSSTLGHDSFRDECNVELCRGVGTSTGFATYLLIKLVLHA